MGNTIRSKPVNSPIRTGIDPTRPIDFRVGRVRAEYKTECACDQPFASFDDVAMPSRDFAQHEPAARVGAVPLTAVPARAHVFFRALESFQDWVNVLVCGESYVHVLEFSNLQK